MSRHRRSVAVVICAGLVGLLLTGATGRASFPGPTRQAGARYRVDVDLVRLSVTARDAKDAIIHDLKPEEFQVLEDGVEQQPTLFGHHETPISVVVLFDASGSMDGEKLMHAKDAVVNFVGALKREDETLVVAFNDRVDALGDFGLDAKTIERATKRLGARGGTRLYDAVVDSSRVIADATRKDKRAILILSDGEDTASIRGLEQAVEAVKSAEVPVYAIGIEIADWAPGPAGDPL